LLFFALPLGLRKTVAGLKAGLEASSDFLWLALWSSESDKREETLGR